LVWEDSVSILLRCFALLLGVMLAGCVTSKAPLLSSDSRVLPFIPGTAFETYERDDDRAPWKKNEKRSIFTADSSLVVRELNEDGSPKDEAIYTFHPLGGERFLVQARFKPSEDYAYGVLEVRNGEGMVTGLNCKAIDQAAFRRDGGKVVADFCELDSAPDPLALLRKLGANPLGVRIRYVPVK
jgi:hypothetical protein